MFKFELGQEVLEIVTGYQGIVMCRSEYFTGCRHYGLASKTLDPNGKIKEWEYFDESRLKLVEEKKLFDRTGMEDTSGPCSSNPPMIG